MASSAKMLQYLCLFLNNLAYLFHQEGFFTVAALHFFFIRNYKESAAIRTWFCDGPLPIGKVAIGIIGAGIEYSALTGFP